MRIIYGEASIYTHFEDFVVADLISAYKLGSFYFCDAENGKILQSYTRSGDLLAVDLMNAYKFEDISSFWNGFIRRSAEVCFRIARMRINLRELVLIETELYADLKGYFAESRGYV